MFQALNRFKNFKISLSLKLIAIILLALLFGSKIPYPVQSFLYAVSLTLKSILLFILPLVIFSCLFSCLLTFKGKKALGFMVGLLTVVCLSNYFSTMIAYGIHSLNVVDLKVSAAQVATQSLVSLEPLWQFELPVLISNDYALYLGFALGAFFAFFQTPGVLKFNHYSKRFVTLFLEKGFIPVLPFFALGFILKMQYDGVLAQLIESYLFLLMTIIGVYVVYLLFLFGLSAGFKLKPWTHSLKNIVPVALTGFSTMSSLATLPVTMRAAEKNTGNVDLARAVVPATVNIHMIGVSIALPLMALAILSTYEQALPSFNQYAVFALHFILAQLAIAAVPGGAILVTLPTIEKYLGLSGEMSALITTLYILFDPAVTLCNVLGNSALVIFIAKGFKKLTGRASEETRGTAVNTPATPTAVNLS